MDHAWTAWQTESKTVTRNISAGAARMRKLRQRRRNGWIRVISVEIAAMDSIALRCAGYLRQNESARTDLPKAMARLLAEVRDALPPELGG